MKSLVANVGLMLIAVTANQTRSPMLVVSQLEGLISLDFSKLLVGIK